MINTAYVPDEVAWGQFATLIKDKAAVCEILLLTAHSPPFQALPTMPITVDVVNHAATPWKGSGVASSAKLLEEACPRQWRKCEKIQQSSFQSLKSNAQHVTASENGFVWAAYHAYSEHHHLLLRPEDVWFAILTQLSFYINAHAEELRSFFVQHDGQKELEVISDILDFGAVAVQMTDLISKNVNDPDLRGWVMPSFSTTTHHDEVVGAVLFMGAMQAYFSFSMTFACGLPSVTLLGEVEDWKNILGRIDKIDQLGEQPHQFANMLRPILQHMVMTFEDQINEKVTHFWNTIMHRNEVGSGTDYLSGWMTAFCFWNAEGQAKRFGPKLFDAVDFPYVPVDEVPAGFATVPVKVDEFGEKYEATMIAGSVGIGATAWSASNSSATDASLLQADSQQQVSLNDTVSSDDSDTTVRDTVHPVSGWWIVENERQEVKDAREAELKKVEGDLEKYQFDERNTDIMMWMKSENRKKYYDAMSRREELMAF